MIFYFTGTGNSWYAAQKVKNEGEEVINITNCVREKNYKFKLEDDRVGIVCPVYFWGIPSIVAHFLSKLQLENYKDQYVYVLLTCGGSSANAGGMVKKILAPSGISVDAAYTVVLPDNYCLMYDTPSPDEVENIINKAENPLASIKKSIDNKMINKVEAGLSKKLQTTICYSFYRNGRKTEKFFVDETCVGCKTCAKRCPVGAIEMRDKKPVWIKERCVHCLACARCNAVQYGPKTKGRRRYVHPEFKKISCCD